MVISTIPALTGHANYFLLIRANTLIYWVFSSISTSPRLLLNPPMWLRSHLDFDFILTTHPESLNSISNLQEINDHKVIHASFCIAYQKSCVSKKRIKLYDKGNYGAMNQESLLFYNEFTTTGASHCVETNWCLFVNEMRELVELFIPTASIKNNTLAPWFNKALKRLNNKKKRLFRSA